CARTSVPYFYYFDYW
nr:immunoglobulin heavy chain junction region [Mus musculus]